MKRILIYALSIITSLIVSCSFGQGVAINQSGVDPDNSAMLDISSNDKGVLIPRMTQLQRQVISTPAQGLLVFQTDGSSGFYYYNGSAWVLIGAGAESITELSDASTDATSVFLGNGAGDVDDGSNSNVAIGIDALNYNTSGTYNIAAGRRALLENVSGGSNIALGYRALQSNNDGDHNLAMGTYADPYNLHGSGNVIFGSSAGRGAGNADHSKSGNVIIGFEAGHETTDNSDYNVFLGYQAGYNESGANKLYIENSNSSSPLIYGEFNNNLLRVNGTLDINGAYQLPTIDGTSGQVLQTDGSGALSWSTGGGGGAGSLNELSDAIADGTSVFLGNGAGVVDDGSNSNVAIGYDALNTNTSGTYNIAAGRRAMLDNESGGSNIALGYRALQSNIDGDHNLAIGSYSDPYNLHGTENIILGSSAGRGAGNADHSKSGNVIIGFEAGHETTDNSDYNVFLGYQAGYNESGANKLYIENSNSSSPLIYGEFDNNLVRINGTLDINNNYQLPAGDGSSGQVLTTDGSGTIGWATVGSGGGAVQINDLTDAKTLGQCTFLGSGAGSGDNGSGNRNVAVGIDALKLNVGGLYNTTMGYGSLYSNTGDRNTAFGYQSLYNSTSGENNAANGFHSAYSNTTGGQNTTIGHSANYYNQEGSNNTIVGFEAGKGGALHNKTGNVMLGYQAGYNAAGNSDSNVFIGIQAGYNETGSQKLYIENSNSTTPLIYGEFDNNMLRINGTLDISNAFVFPTTDGSNGQVLKSNGGGVLSWTDDSGAYEINDLNDGITGGYSVFLGAGSGLHDNGTDNENTALGDSAFYINTTGAYCTAVGYRALYSNTSGQLNTAVGNDALHSNTWGGENTAVGTFTLGGNTTGSGNTAIGFAAMGWNDTGLGNTALGSYALNQSTGDEKNTAIGFYALYNNDGGDYNTALGYEAAYNNTSGHDNCAVGYQALFANTDGIENTIFGNGAARSNSSGYENTVIGTNGLHESISGYQNVAIGNNAAYNNETGYFNTIIGYEADYHNEAGFNNTMIGYKAGHGTTGHTKYGNVFIGHEAGAYETGNNKLYIDNSSTQYPLIYGEFGNKILAINGSLGIGTTTPDEMFEIDFGTAGADVEIGQGTSDYNVTFIALDSPNGTKYYITVDDSGNLSASTTHP